MLVEMGWGRRGLGWRLGGRQKWLLGGAFWGVWNGGNGWQLVMIMIMIVELNCSYDGEDDADNEDEEEGTEGDFISIYLFAKILRYYY